LRSSRTLIVRARQISVAVVDVRAELDDEPETLQDLDAPHEPRIARASRGHDPDPIPRLERSGIDDSSVEWVSARRSTRRHGAARRHCMAGGDDSTTQQLAP
jgi:hypothetical protein